MTQNLYHRFWGDGEPVVVIHGLFGSMENLGVITRQLQEAFLVYALDLPNHGRSYHSQKCSIPDTAGAVIAWMDAAGLRKAHFLGHSLGGKVSMEIALRYPERVSTLIVADIAPVSYERRHDSIFAAFRAVDLTAIKNRADADQAMASFVGDVSTRSFLLKNLEKVDGAWRWRININYLEKAYPDLIDANSEELPAFNKPTLFIKGERSDYILPEYKTQILKLFPEASVKVIRDSGHWLHAEKPDIFASIVKRFLNKAEAK